MKDYRELKEELLKDPEVKAEYDSLNLTRLIDANKLKDRLVCDPATYDDLHPRAVIYEEDIDNAKTVDAIPVEAIRDVLYEYVNDGSDDERVQIESTMIVIRLIEKMRSGER